MRMREIKFRAWDKACNCMITDMNNRLHIYLNGSVSINGVWATEDIILMPYTGLRDKSGKEIYEGDIVRDWEEAQHVVEYDEGFLWPFVFDSAEEKTDSNESIVIGNIYENPELLEKTNV